MEEKVMGYENSWQSYFDAKYKIGNDFWTWTWKDSSVGVDYNTGKVVIGVDLGEAQRYKIKHR